MERGGTIHIEEEVVTEPRGKAARIHIRDSGPGIPESIRDKMFEPFFTTKDDGTGLGLSIALRIITEHGGWLNVKSEEGKGAEFTIGLPIKE
jgi:signal transduction histidine kinase